MVVGEELLCTIEIRKEGHTFIATVETQEWEREYKDAVFGDLLGDIVMDLQEDLGVD